MNMYDKDELFNTLLEKIKNEEVTYKQYLHKNACKTGPCDDLDVRGNRKENPKDTCCAPFIGHVHASDQLHKLPKHPYCDCYYVDVLNLLIGEISDRQPAPDVWLKLYGKLPDYYIPKEEAEKLGWKPSKHLSNFAPGKMIGGNIYYNDEHILPEKEGRTWKHCDINYESGDRNSLRLYYSNDGLMFYSTNHLNDEKGSIPIVFRLI